MMPLLTRLRLLTTAMKMPEPTLKVEFPGTWPDYSRLGLRIKVGPGGWTATYCRIRPGHENHPFHEFHLEWQYLFNSVPREGGGYHYEGLEAFDLSAFDEERQTQ